MKNVKTFVVVLAFLFLSVLTGNVSAEDYQFARDLTYRPDHAASKECLVDIAYKAGNTNKPVVVWFHGGGLTGGHRELPRELMTRDLVLVGVEYRLMPKVTVDELLDDSAAAVAWVFENITKYGGDPKNIFLAGHSAGGYIVNMLALDKSRLSAYKVDADLVAGVIPYSGHTITHYAVRNQRNMPPHQGVIDETAPLYHVRGDAPAMLLLSGDREKELYGRYEETAYFWRMMKLAGHKDITLYELDGYDHGGMARPGHPLAVEFIFQHLKK